MDWTAKIPYQWDWETLAQFSGKEVDDGHVNSHRNSNESVYSSGGGAGSNSELGNGSSRSSVSIGSPSNAGNRIPELNFDSGDQSTGDLKENKVLARMESGILHTVESSYGPKEPLIGLKLGKRTYFEDVCRGINIRSSSSLASMNSSIDLVKKPKVSQQNMQSSHCQVDGCNDDLAAVKDYHRKHRVCERHSKSPKVTVAGHDCRFCQQCSRFHDLSEFDQNKRSCRKRLYDHNARRRKPQPEAMSFGSSMLSPSYFDDGQQMSFVFSQAPLGQVTNMASSTWDDSGLFKLFPTKGSLVDLSEGGINEHMHFPSTRSNKVSTVHHTLDRLLPFKGTTAEVLNKGLGAHVAASNLYGAPDLRRVLSLLSYEPWVPSNLEPISDFQFVNANTNAAHSAIHPTNSTTGIWQQDELPPTRSTPFDWQSNGSRLQLHRTL